MPDNSITCPSCVEVNLPGTKACGFYTLPLTSRPGRVSDDGTRIINDTFEPKNNVFTPGTLIANRYKILREPGRGGMGGLPRDR